MNTETDSKKTVTGVIKTITADPAVKVVAIVLGALAIVYFAGIAFKIVAGTVREFKGLSSAIKS